MTKSKVLLVEDDEHSRFLMSEVFEELSVVFEVAEDGVECLEILDHRPTDFETIFMDVHMPNKSGVEALQEIRRSNLDPPRNIRIVAVSADNHWHDEVNAIEAGFDAVLPKPVSFKGISRLLM